MDLSPLRACIISILRQSDLNKISAKVVRMTLIQDPIYSPSIPAGADLNGADKTAINELIRECFVAVNEDLTRAAAQNPAGGIALPGTGGVPGGYQAPASE